MKVILLRDVAKIGRRFDIVEVPDGYALNKLVPQGSAQPATPENVKRVRATQSSAAKGQAESARHFDVVVAALTDKTPTLAVTANADGGLFEAVKPKLVAEALTKAVGLPVPVEYVVIPSPIKHVGTHTIELVRDRQHVPVTLSVIGSTKS